MKSALWIAAVCLLALAPVSAQTPEATAVPSVVPSPVDGGRVLYPANSVQVTPVTARGNAGDTPGISGLAMSFLLLLALCAGGFYLLRRQTGFTPVGKGHRKLMVSESRSLGNRQFLVVVEYESERVLLGVTPGKIDYLCPLPIKGPVSP